MEHQHSYSKYELVNMASVRLKSPLRLTPDDMALSFELSCAVALSLLIGRMPGEWLKRKDRPCARLPPLSVRGPPGLCRAQHRTRFVCLGAPLATCTLPVGMFHLLTYSGLCPRPPFRRTRPDRTGARAPGAPPVLTPSAPSAGHRKTQEASLIHNRELPGVPAVGDPARCAYGKGRT
jgi:hypothetical protein